MTTTRPTGAIATILATESLLEAGRRQFALQYPDADPQKLNNGLSPQMMIPVNHGELAIVNREGVGTIADEHNIIDVWFSYEYELLPVAIPTSEIANTTTDEKIDLAHGIRTFGDRLDANHWRWYSRYDHDA